MISLGISIDIYTNNLESHEKFEKNPLPDLENGIMDNVKLRPIKNVLWTVWCYQCKAAMQVCRSCVFLRRCPVFVEAEDVSFP